MVNILTVSNPIYSKADNSTIDCTVTFDTIDGTHVYTAAAHDGEPHGIELWAALKAGTYGAVSAYVAPTLTAAQKAMSSIEAGIAITSTGTPAVNGTYPLDVLTQAKINGAITYIMINGAFPPASAATFPLYDISGIAKIFPNIAVFKAFATAFADYIAHIDIYASSNGDTGSIPSNAITIP